MVLQELSLIDETCNPF